MRTQVLALAAAIAGCQQANVADYFDIRRPERVSDRLGVSLESASSEITFGLFARSEMGRASHQRVRDLIAEPRSPSARGPGDGRDPVIMAGEFDAAAPSVAQLFPQVLATPYWVSAFFQVSATGAGCSYSGINLVYPIYLINDEGAKVREIGKPPKSWRQARAPEFGEFPTAQSQEWIRYLSSFTMIAGLAALGDSVLIVNHGVRSQAKEGVYGITHTFFDVYVGDNRVLTDVPSPGVIVAHSGGSVFFARRASDGWELVEYAWRGNSRR